MGTEIDTKTWYQSKTLWGVIVSAVGKLVAGYFSLTVTDVDLGHATDAVVALTNADSLNAAIALGASFVGDAFAFYGRVKAEKTIGK